jgi:hypothetical protein
MGQNALAMDTKWTQVDTGGYWMISSARASTEGGIVRPSVCVGSSCCPSPSACLET